MFCTQCGHETAPTARFCQDCGTAIPGAAPFAPPPGVPQRLHRIPGSGIVAGNCAGLARFSGIDVTVVRFLVVSATVCTGVIPGVLCYLLAWFIMPVASEAAPPVGSYVRPVAG